MSQRPVRKRDIHTVHLTDLYNPKLVDLQVHPDCFDEMLEDIHKEACIHGDVAEMWADTSGHTSSVWVRVVRASVAGYFAGVMHQRWFAGQHISANFIKDRAGARTKRVGRIKHFTVPQGDVTRANQEKQEEPAAAGKDRKEKTKSGGEVSIVDFEQQKC